VTYSDGVISVTTWHVYDGQRLWRARHGDDVRYFTAGDNSDYLLLLTVGKALLGLPVGPNAADLLTVGT
jgi:hypothetical protein